MSKSFSQIIDEAERQLHQVCTVIDNPDYAQEHVHEATHNAISMAGEVMKEMDAHQTSAESK